MQQKVAHIMIFWLLFELKFVILKVNDLQEQMTYMHMWWFYKFQFPNSKFQLRKIDLCSQ